MPYAAPGRCVILIQKPAPLRFVMDRDAPVAPISPADAVPPSSPESVRLIGLIGVGLTATAAILALAATAIGDSTPAVLHTVRLVLSFVGVITAGAAISMRPDRWWAWALASLAAGLGVVGLPGDWDSFHPLFRVLTGLAAIGAVVCAASFAWRVAIASLAILFHFGGIFMAATAPDPRPWLNEQLYTRVYNPYLQFVYLRNAYQYYSPNPGPASVLAFLLKTETGVDPETKRKTYTTQWVVTPTRPADVRDPLGLSYYRRLSLTQQIAQGNLGLTVPTEQFEKSEIWYRRSNRSGFIPFHPAEPIAQQYQLPNAEVARFTIPSYASHVVLEHTPDKETAAKTTVKVYRVEHRTMSVEEFIPAGPYKRGMPPGSPPPSPYTPTTYRPYFLGEFDARGNLLNPQEEFLYWLLPIIPRGQGPNDPIKKSYIDYMSVHALDMTPQQVLEADEKSETAKVFNWSQLR